jgi:hypothetical protein
VAVRGWRAKDDHAPHARNAVPPEDVVVRRGNDVVSSVDAVDGRDDAIVSRANAMVR